MGEPSSSAVPSVNVAALGHNITCILRSGRVSEQQAQVLQGDFDGLHYCSVGVHVKDFGTVITTDNLLSSGLFNLSLCPSKSSVAGCVIARATLFHDQVSLHRSGVPVDITYAIQQHKLRSAVCVPVALPKVTSEGETVASERILGTFTLASRCEQGVTAQHRVLAERVAAALAPSFADATSSMYNNITDYVLGPMHGHPYPIAAQPRPLPSTSQDPNEGCWTDDSDPSDDNFSMSQSLLVTESGEGMDSAAEDPLAFSSTWVNAEALSPMALSQHPLALSKQPQQQDQQQDHHQHQHQDQQQQDQQKHDLAAADPSDKPQVQSEDIEEPTSNQRIPLERPSSQEGGAPTQSDKQPNPYQQAASRLPSHHLSTAQRHSNQFSTELKHQFSQDGSARSSFSFTLPLHWIGSKRSRSDDSAHENESSSTKAHKSQGSIKESPKALGITEEPEATRQASYKQHSFLLRFYDYSIERQFCLWQAQQRTMVQLCFSMVVIVVMLCVRHVTPYSQRGVVLWLPPLLQLVPTAVLFCKPHWYLDHNELLSVTLNIMKAVWTVNVAVPYPGSFWTPGKRLAVLWKFGLDSLMVSGLGELARFSTFLWVQAIDLAIITTRAGVLCESLPEGSFLSPYRCMAMVLSTHFVVTYALIGSVVWKMDQQERRSFLYQHQRANAAVQ